MDEIVYGDNDSLSAVVATLIHADALVILTETDGLYTANPMKNPDARRIARVEEITDEIRSFASGDGTAPAAWSRNSTPRRSPRRRGWTPM